jgi:lysophospholipase L1-like esterase
VLDENGALVIQNYPVKNTDSFWVNAGTFLKKHFQLPRFIAQTLSLRGSVPGWLKPVVVLFAGGEDAGKGNTAVSANSAQSPTSRTKPATICDTEYTPEIEEAWNITKALIQELRTEVEANGAQFMVVSIPTLAQTIPPADGTSWYCPRPNEELNAFLEAEEIPYLDLLPAFQAYSPEGGKLLYYERDFHMTALGHKEAGTQIGLFLLANLD